MFLLDTNIVSELNKPRPHGGVIAWARAFPPESYNIAAIVLYELQAGAELMRHKDEACAFAIESWIEQIVATHRVVALEQVAARMAARLMKGRPQPMFEDALIAATAKTNRLIVATRNTRDFEQFAVELVNPFLYR
jgi:predicted nucleic acid-binding protein